MAASGTFTGKITTTIWDLATDKAIAAYSAHDNIVLSAALSPNGQQAATGGGNHQEIHLWNAKSGLQDKRLAGQGATRWAAGFSADGRHLAWGNAWSAGHSSTPQPLTWQLR